MMVSKYQKARIFLVSVFVINANIKTKCELDNMLAIFIAKYSDYCENHGAHCKTYLGKVPIKQ